MHSPNAHLQERKFRRWKLEQKIYKHYNQLLIYLRDKQDTFTLGYTISFFGGMPVFKVAKFEPRDIVLPLRQSLEVHAFFI